MTKYVLNSGGIRNEPKKAKEYFAEVLKGLGAQPRLLICCFAKPREDWEQAFAGDQRSEFLPEGVTPEYKLAYPETFEQQVAECDAMYMHGGDDYLLQHWLRKFDLPKIWNGKVVATNSAGSHALVTHFWTCDWRKTMDGLGILPIKFLAHYKSDYGSDDPRGPIDWDAAYKELEAYRNTSLPIHALREGEYVVIEQ